MLAPLVSSTPITCSGVFLMRIVLPMGLTVWNSFSTTVRPMTHTLAAVATSRSLKLRPWMTRPVADRHVAVRRRPYLAAAPVGVAVDDLAVEDDQRAGGDDAVALADDGVASPRGERADGAPAASGPACFLAPGKTTQHVGAEALELALHGFGGALPDRDHRRDGGDADDHAEDGQAGAELVLQQGPRRDA